MRHAIAAGRDQRVDLCVPRRPGALAILDRVREPTRATTPWRAPPFLPAPTIPGVCPPAIGRRGSAGEILRRPGPTRRVPNPRRRANGRAKSGRAPPRTLEGSSDAGSFFGAWRAPRTRFLRGRRGRHQGARVRQALWGGGLIPLLLQAATLHAGDPATVAGASAARPRASRTSTARARRRSGQFLCGRWRAGLRRDRRRGRGRGQRAARPGPACRLAMAVSRRSRATTRTRSSSGRAAACSSASR